MKLKTDPKYLAKMVREYGERAPIESSALAAHAREMAVKQVRDICDSDSADHSMARLVLDQVEERSANILEQLLQGSKV